MGLPRKVQQELEAAEAIVEQINKGGQAAPEPSLEDLAKLAANDVPPTPGNEAPAQQTAPQPAPSPAPEPAPSEPPKPTVDWEHKFKTLQGLFNSEMPKLQTRVKELERQLVETQSKPAPAPEPAKPAADPKDVENFGADMVEMVTRNAEAITRKLAGDVLARITALENALKSTQQNVTMTAEEMFFDRLAKAVPDWQTINANESFLNWLAEIDPVYGQPRQAALNYAQQSLDASRAVAVFNAWKATQQPAAKAAPSVDQQISPRPAASAPAPATENKPVISQKQITAFYDDVARGKYRGREQEAAKIEQTINLALVEGRVR